MSPKDFVSQYEKALATQEWSAVEPLVHSNICVTFSNGISYRGKQEVRAAYEKNFSLISGEEYRMTNLHWVLESDSLAVFLFDFRWSGIIGGEKAQGAGKGTSTLLNNSGEWKLLAEHLGPAAS